MEEAGSLEGVRFAVEGLSTEQEAACIAKGAVILDEADLEDEDDEE